MRPLAFPTLEPEVHVRAAALGVDIEQSFRGFMALLFDCSPFSPRVDELIERCTVPEFSAQPQLREAA